MRAKVFGFLLISMISLQANAGKLTLTLRPSTLLPGTSADISVTLTNDSADQLVVESRVSLRVKPPVDESFLAGQLPVGDFAPYRDIPSEFRSLDAKTIAVAPASKFAFSIPFLDPTTFFRDPRFLTPGRYDLSAGMVTADGTQLWSDETPLYIVEPTGLDAPVWARMKEVCGSEGCAWGEWQGHDLDTEVLSKFSESGYALYATDYRFAGASDAALRREVGMRGPYRDHILLFEADHVMSKKISEAIMRRDHGAAVRAAAETSAALKQIISETSDEFVRVAATAALDSVPTPPEITEILKELGADEKNAPAKKIVPSVNCVSPLSTGEWLAWFGYENPFGHDLWLGVSTGKNKFEPKPHERGQTENFKKDGEAKAFSVTFDGEPLTWFIKGEKATASKSFPTRCPD